MTQSAASSHVQDLSAALVRLVGAAAPGIVAVKSGHSRSSGFFWRPGLIVTADEALSEEGDFTVTHSPRMRRRCSSRISSAMPAPAPSPVWLPAIER